MKHAALVLAVLFGSLSANSQDKDKYPEKGKTQEKMTPQKPQKEHELLKQFEGEWDVRAKHYMPALEESHGTEMAKVKLLPNFVIPFRPKLFTTPGLARRGAFAEAVAALAAEISGRVPERKAWWRFAT